MKIKYFLFAIITVSFISCAPLKINQYTKEGKIQKRDGKWVETNPTEQGDFVSKGRYKMGNKVGVWKTNIDGVKFQREAFRRDLIKTKVFHPNGIVKIKGQSTTETTDDYIHWFYKGDWKHYNENGKLIYIKKYHQGKPLDSISYQN